MKKILLILSVLAASALLPLRAQELPFAGGEDLKYTIHYKYGVNADCPRANVVYYLYSMR